MGPIQFEVCGLPPKKRRRNGSMWRTEAKKLSALRNAALKALGQPDFIKREPYFKEEVQIRLTLCVHVESRPEANLGEKGSGDLDNFVSGVCDGLMKAHKNALPWIEKDKELWPDNSIHPSGAIAFEDDKQVMEICAKKLVHDEDDWYEIEVEELGREGRADP